ncbi:MAG: Rieske 2Fe-2S domain-containing protein [Alphaproteobacteria bacterium]|nr:Rieske 2Fe-2S domain-containing protein [Alphaproteobacteria bacterium]
MRYSDAADYVIDDPARGEFRVHRDVFSDQDLFEEELKNVFEGTWVFLCLESQIPQPHDFHCARIGRRSVIVSRDGDGAVHCFYNTCRHRGATLCHTERGNRSVHVCDYHGWAYDSGGRNVDIKDRDFGCYRDEFGEENHDLVPVARLDSYRGFIFASLNPDVLSLEEHLGDARTCLDLIVDQGPDGMELVPGRTNYTYDANWKLQLDNGSDPYHLTSTHRSFMRIVHRRAEGKSANTQVESPDFQKRFAMPAGMFTFDRGHSMIWADHPVPENKPLSGTMERVRAHAGEVRAKWMLRTRNTTIFPNLQFNDSTSLVLRTITPLSVDRTEMQVYSFGPIGEPLDLRRRRVRQHEDFFNVSGLATPDDTLCYADCQDGYYNLSGDWLQGFQRGMAAVTHGPNDPARELGIAPATSVLGKYSMQNEMAFHAAYREWVRLMTLGRARDQRLAAE